jgi:lipopolysaccharide transport system ATP-binding protein
MNAPPILSLENVGVSYTHNAGFLKKTRFWALEDVSLELFKGQTLGVIGRNGAGKSTLLKLLANIIEPDRGRISRNHGSATMLSLQLGFLPALTGRQNAILSGLLMGFTRKHMERLLPEIIDFSELQEFIDEPISTYSTGMRARLGFSVAMQASPDLLLVDEVLGVGDSVFKEKSGTVLRKLIQSNKSVILVSHQMETIEKMCDAVVWIENRVTRQFGLPKEVIKSYLAHSSKPSTKPVTQQIK